MTQVTPSRVFTILYTSREGSSAIIGKLQKHSNIHVPCFEHLDLPNLEKVVEDPRSQICEILDQACKAGVVPGDNPTYSGEAVIGFKWRPFGDVVSTLAKHNCLVVFLYRRNTLRRALSMHYKPEHTQFKISLMDAKERDALLEQTRAGTFSVDPEALARTLTKYTEAKRTIWRKYVKPLQEHLLLEYEKFEESPTEALNSVLEALGLEPFTEEPASLFVKTMRRDIESQCENLDEALKHEGVQKALLAYESFLKRRGVQGSG